MEGCVFGSGIPCDEKLRSLNFTGAVLYFFLFCRYRKLNSKGENYAGKDKNHVELLQSALTSGSNCDLTSARCPILFFASMLLSFK